MGILGHDTVGLLRLFLEVALMRTVILSSVLVAVMFGLFSVAMASAQQLQANAQPAPSKTPYYPTTYIYQESRQGLRLDNDGPPAPAEGAKTERSATVRAIVRDKSVDDSGDIAP